jgi:putative transposase
MESFWGSMQIELLNRQKWRTNLELAIATADYIEHFYNCGTSDLSGVR